MTFLQGRGQVSTSMTKPAPNWKWNRLSLAASGLSFSLQLCSWIAMWEQQSFHETSLDCLLIPLSQCQLSTDSPAAIQFSIATKKNVPTGVIFNQIFKFKTLLEASSLEGYFSFRISDMKRREWQMFIVHQRWHCALGQEPLSQHFGQLWTPAISPFLVSFSKPNQFHLVRNKLFPTMCLVWKSEEQQRFGGCSKSSTSGGRNLYARYRLAQSLACARPAWQVRNDLAHSLYGDTICPYMVMCSTGYDLCTIFIRYTICVVCVRYV